MEEVVLIIHLVIALALVGTVLLQRSEGGALGMGGGGVGGFMSARGASNFLTRLTAILAAAFIGTSLTLGVMGTGQSGNRSIVEEAPVLEEPAALDESSVPFSD